jgi:hypothetical protein
VRRRAEIYVGDLVLAARALDASPQTAVAIAELLGFAAVPSAEPVQVLETRRDETPELTPQGEGEAEAEDEPVATEAEAEPVVPSELTRSTASPLLPSWLSRLEPLDAAGAATEPDPEPEPLFLPRWTPGILAAAVSARDREGPVDVDRIVRRLAHARPLEELPRLPWPTLRHGAQILVDASSGLDPFSRDQVHLVARLRRIVGSERVEVLRFVGCPTRGAGTGPVRTWMRYEPPRTGKPVVLLTDLGVGLAPFATDRAGTGEWLAFAERVRAAGCPLVAFVPYPRVRVPRALRRALAVVPWDRTTSIGAVRRLVGPVLEPTR